MTKMTIPAFEQLMREELPLYHDSGFELMSIGRDEVTMRAHFSEKMLRPGGTISGPTMMALADAAAYALVLSNIGDIRLAVTTNLNINFFKRPAAEDVVATVKPLKVGKRLVVAEVYLHSESEQEAAPIAHATVTYSIPPLKSETEHS